MEEGVAGTLDPRYREEFRRFIETGQASEDFLAYLNESEECQRAVEQVFEEQAAHFQDLVRSLALTETTEDLGRSLSPPAAAAFRRWNWRGAYPYALAASLMLAVLSGFLVWNVALVARQDEQRAALFEDRYSEKLLEQHTSQQKVASLQQELAAKQGELAKAESLGPQNQKYRSELWRLRGQKARLEKALASTRQQEEKARKELVEMQNQPQRPPSSTVVDLKPPEPEKEQSSPSPADPGKPAVGRDPAHLEPPKVTTPGLFLPPEYALASKEIPVEIYIEKSGDATDWRISKKVSDKVRDAVGWVVDNSRFQPGTRGGEPASMWTPGFVGSRTTGAGRRPIAYLKLSEVPPG